MYQSTLYSRVYPTVMIQAGIMMNMTTYLDLWDMERTLEGRLKF